MTSKQEWVNERYAQVLEKFRDYEEWLKNRNDRIDQAVMLFDHGTMYHTLFSRFERYKGDVEALRLLVDIIFNTILQEDYKDLVLDNITQDKLHEMSTCTRNMPDKKLPLELIRDRVNATFSALLEFDIDYEEFVGKMIFIQLSASCDGYKLTLKMSPSIDNQKAKDLRIEILNPTSGMYEMIVKRNVIQYEGIAQALAKRVGYDKIAKIIL